jgi:hypothetical protein
MGSHRALTVFMHRHGKPFAAAFQALALAFGHVQDLAADIPVVHW